jgi:MSHA pilin protein MshD
MKKIKAGFTLIEMVIAIVIISIGLVGVIPVLNITTRFSADPILKKHLLMVSEAMLEEIMLRDYANAECLPSCLPNNSVDRPNYTAVDYYNGWNQLYKKDIADNDIPAPFNTFTVTVSVALTADLGASIPAKKITVKTTYKSDSITLIGYRTDHD